jgi:hypothetical protein
MDSRSRLRMQQAIIGTIAPAIHDISAAPYEVTPARYAAYMHPVHDVGGEPDLPVPYEEKDEEQWELDTYVTCEVLAWRGHWNAEERRRRGNVDVGLSVYLGVPYYGRWILAAARMLVDKNKISLTELMDKIAEVKARHDAA